MSVRQDEALNLQSVRIRPMQSLGIPSVEDKLVQIMLKKILEQIYEAEFLDVSYGFRPKLSCHDAVKALDKTVMTKPINYIVEVDIKGFFD
jgi:RNA-directed DNA polymerase